MYNKWRIYVSYVTTANANEDSVTRKNTEKEAKYYFFSQCGSCATNTDIKAWKIMLIDPDGKIVKVEEDVIVTASGEESES